MILSRVTANTGMALAIQEMLYGFIMELIFISAARFGILQYSEPEDLIILILGMNFTWGAIDSVLFYVIDLMNQRRMINYFSSDVGKNSVAEKMIDDFGGTPLSVIRPEDAAEICSVIITKPVADREKLKSDRKKMRSSAFSCFIITILTVIPVVVPLLVIDDVTDALTVASVISSMIIFVVGWKTGTELGFSGWKAGLFLAALAWSITIIATFTGGRRIWRRLRRGPRKERHPAASRIWTRGCPVSRPFLCPSPCVSDALSPVSSF